MEKSPSPNIYSVAALTTQIKKLLEMSYVDVWVEGEVSSIANPSSGHTYFTLKDEGSILKCVLFKNKKYLASSLPVTGERILIRGRISMYAGRAEVQLICSYVEAAGEGQLRRQYEALKATLQAEGLFDEDKKQAIPKQPKTIALITSLEGAVLHDIISTLKRRYPLVRLAVYPTNVQGDSAKETVLEALKLATHDTPDTIILARGGGSLEDLHLFNDETLARAIFACPIPLVSAIGHETDFVISDFVADIRAPTPTAAASMCTPDIAELSVLLKQNRSGLNNLISLRVNSNQQQLDFAHQRLKHPYDQVMLQNNQLQRSILKLSIAHRDVVQRCQQQLERVKSNLRVLSPQSQLNGKRYLYNTTSEHLQRNITQSIKTANSMLGQLQTKLQALSPHNTLSRGYSILQNQHNQIVKNATQIKENETLKATLYQGKLDVVVKAKSN